jgi:hypothetical protein
MRAHLENAGPILLGVSIAMLLTSAFTTALRCVVRYQRGSLGLDDYTMVVSALLAVGRCIVQWVSIAAGNGIHRRYLSTEEYQHVNFLSWVTQLILFPLLGLLKISVCLLVLRIRDTKLLKRFLWTLMAFLVVSSALPEFVLLAECHHVSAYWKGDKADCWPDGVRIYSIYFQTGGCRSESVMLAIRS